jgi:hypothetical protein
MFEVDPNRTLSFIETLSREQVGTVLGQLVKITGTEGIINDADTPVILRNIRNLACTSKTMYNAVNDPIVVEIFLTFLAEKQQKTAVHFAAAFDTLGTRRWLWSYIRQNNYEKTYRVIQDIYALATIIKEESLSAGPHFDLGERSTQPDALTYRTETGFVLLHQHKKPLHIVTPFGKLPLYKQVDACYELSLLELFIKRLDATFAGISYKAANAPPDPGEYHVVTISDLNDHCIRNIADDAGEIRTRAQLTDQVGTQNLITSSHGGTKSVYTIRKVEDRLTPEVTFPPKESRPDLVLLSVVWKMLETVRLGGDPVNQKTIQRIPWFSAPPEALRTLSDISEGAIDLVRQLALQPSRLGCKILPLQDYKTARSFELLNNAAKQFLNSSEHLHIDAVSRNLVLKEKNPFYLLLSLVGLDWRTQPCDLETLKIGYDHALSQIGLHWRRSHLKDYPNVQFMQSEEEYILFVKNEDLGREIGFIETEDKFIQSIANALGISRYLEVDSSWAKEPHESLPPQPLTMYLWIKKNQFDLVSRLLNLREEPS